MIRPRYTAHTHSDYVLAVGAVLLGGGVAFLLSLVLARMMVGLTAHLSTRLISWATLGVLVIVVAGITGWPGLAICA
ncbi:MAG: hypothetical protein MUQ10_17020, partial [Anaerolineae bacterium]|nr:hypothetical protein [Anaerolineae bacterium]